MKLSITESDIHKMVFECIMKLREESNGDDLESLLAYLSQKPDTSVRNRGDVNLKAKAYNYFEPKGIVRDVWALHYTYMEAYENIIKNGFVHGCTDLDNLGYSSSKFDDDGNGDMSANYGWCFALPANGEYLGEDRGYGDMGFLINTDGVLAYHKIDGDDEIIFKHDNVKEAIPFTYEEDSDEWWVPGVKKAFKDVRSMVEYLIRN